MWDRSESADLMQFCYKGITGISYPLSMCNSVSISLFSWTVCVICSAFIVSELFLWLPSLPHCDPFQRSTVLYCCHNGDVGIRLFR